MPLTQKEMRQLFLVCLSIRGISNGKDTYVNINTLLEILKEFCDTPCIIERDGSRYELKFDEEEI